MSTFTSLYDKYAGFETPTFTLEFDGTVLPQNREQIRIETLSAELSGREKAGALHITAEFIQPDGNDAATWISALELGAKVELSIGYQKEQTDVFCGCLYEIHYLGGEDAADQFGFELVCLDVKALMMDSGHFAFSGQKQAGTVIQEILSRPQYADFISKKEVTNPPDAWNLPMLLSRDSDYEVLQALAESICYEFYIFADSLYFVKPRTVTAPVVEFDGINGILELERTASLAGQAQKVTVTGFNDIGERITSSSERASESRTGGGKLADVLSGSVQIQADTGVKTMEQAQYLAQERIKRIEHRYGSLECICCGLPELRPGRFVKISGVRAQFNGSFYIREVSHILDDSGFSTVFTAEG